MSKEGKGYFRHLWKGIAFACFVLVLALMTALGYSRGYALSKASSEAEDDAAYATRAATGSTTLAPYKYATVSGANGFDVTISYDEPIRCNEPVTFTVNASGRSGEFMYQPYRLTDKGTFNSLQDFSYSPLVASNKITVTFDYNCTVDFTIIVSDKNDLATYTRPVFTFSVDDPNAYSKDEIPALAKQKADQVYKECQAQKFTSQYETALWLHDWIIDHCTYDSTYRHTEASDLFVFGIGTCEAYHAAYMELLKRAGIECGRVYDNGHVWTLVKIDGEWCHVDTTGETPGSDYFLGDLGRHKLFGLNDDIITAKLKSESAGNEIKGKDPSVSATSLKNNYLIRSGRIHDYSDDYRDAVRSHIEQGDEAFSIPVHNSNWPASYKIIFNSLVAYQLSTESWQREGKDVLLSASYANDVLSFSVSLKPNGSDVGRQAMYRLYNPGSGEHFYTASAYERDAIVKVGWKYEGIGWYAPSAGADVYRLYNPNGGDHHYTTSAVERDMLVKVGWRYEGVGWKSGGSVPLYRQYNPNAQTGSHNFTTSKLENDWLASVGWHPEGVAWYGIG